MQQMCWRTLLILGIMNQIPFNYYLQITCIWHISLAFQDIKIVRYLQHSPTWLLLQISNKRSIHSPAKLKAETFVKALA